MSWKLEFVDPTNKKLCKMAKSILDACLPIPFTAKKNQNLKYFILVRNSANLTFNEIAGSLCFFEVDQSRIYLAGIALKAQFRGIGLGSFMLAELKKELKTKEIKTIDLHTLESQELVEFYERNGFYQVELVLQYYKMDLRNAFYMRCEII
jgi:ribosomal protein S18 acetylase RimI-like enzyme